MMPTRHPDLLQGVQPPRIKHGRGTVRRSLTASCWIVFLFLCVAPVRAQEVEVPLLSRYATDLTGSLTAGQLDILESKLREFDKATSTQIVVLMVPGIGSWPLEQFTLKVAEKNAIGRKGKDNGALLFVAKDDREVRIEVGYGLEGTLTDALSGLIIRREIIPRFREGDFFGGVNAGAEAILLATKNEYTAEPGEDSGEVRLPTGLLLFILFIIVMNIFRNRGGRFSRSGGFPMGGFPMGGSWGGRSGGGGSGGFSGGGGSFGGGGASGRW